MHILTIDCNTLALGSWLKESWLTVVFQLSWSLQCTRDFGPPWSLRVRTLTLLLAVTFSLRTSILAFHSKYYFIGVVAQFLFTWLISLSLSWQLGTLELFIMKETICDSQPIYKEGKSNQNNGMYFKVHLLGHFQMHCVGVGEIWII